MKEEILKKYFEGTVTVDILCDDLTGAVEIRNTISHHKIIDNKSDVDFILKSNHLVKLCNDVLNKRIKLSDLNVIAFALEASDYFVWDPESSDGKRVSEVVFHWDCPAINYPITIENVKLWLHYLNTGESKLSNSHP